MTSEDKKQMREMMVEVVGGLRGEMVEVVGGLERKMDERFENLEIKIGKSFKDVQGQINDLTKEVRANSKVEWEITTNHEGRLREIESEVGIRPRERVKI